MSADGEGTTRSPRREFVAQFAAPLRAYLRTETGSAGLLLAATVVALVWANSPLADLYRDIWSLELSVGIGSLEYHEDLRHFVNDGLMVFFFFVIGLELRRQLAMGELTDPRRVRVPAIAALAGLALPALIYLAFNPSGEAARGWGIAMATDTAFVLGALALVGPAFPEHLRVFMLSLSVFDDIGALAAIAIFYSDDVQVAWLGVAALCVLVIVLLGRLQVWRGPVYFVAGLILWLAMLESGVHPTLGGVAVGLVISVYPPRPEEVARAGALVKAFYQSPLPDLARSAKLSVERAVSPNERLQEVLHPWSSYVIVPIFALANAGVEIDGQLVRDAIASPITHGIVAGLVLGKFLGISIATKLAVALRLGSLPPALRYGEVRGGAALAGIGFTISLFVADLAFDSPELADEARLGVLTASLVAALFGAAVFALDRRLAGDDAWAPPMVLDPPVDPERDHIRGPAAAPLELVEYGDFECPFCGRATGAVEAVRKRFGDELRYVFRHLPLADVHPHAELAAEAAEAAAQQGAFWPMFDRLFAHQDRLDPEDLLEHAEELGLDMVRFTRDLGSGEFQQRVREDVASAQASGATGTPTFFVNGRRHVGRFDAETLAAALLDGRPEGEEEPAATTDGDRPRGAALAATGLQRARDDEWQPLDYDALRETPDEDGSFPRLDRDQIAMLERFGERRTVPKGSPVYRDGEPGGDFVVVISGMLAMVDGFGTRNRVGRVHGRGRFIGELGILSGVPLTSTPVAVEDSEVLIVPNDRLAPALASDPATRDLIARAYLLRRSALLRRVADADARAAQEREEEDEVRRALGMDRGAADSGSG
jgi:Na+/H+ antiporter NhaA